VAFEGAGKAQDRTPGVVEETPAPAVGAAPLGGAVGLLLGAQQSLGNSLTVALARRLAGGRAQAVARQTATPDAGTAPSDAGTATPSAGAPTATTEAPASTPEGGASTSAPGAEGAGASSAELAAAEAFKGHAPFGPQDVIGGEGSSTTGGFEATYTPASEELTVRVRCGVVFKDAITGSGEALTADPSVPNLLASLPPPGPARTAFVQAHQWQGADKAAFLTKMKGVVEKAWSGQYEFHVNKPSWQWIGSTVHVDIQATEQSGGRAANEHLEIEVIKLPPTESLGTVGGGSFTEPGSATSATDQKMTVGSTDVDPRIDNLLRDSVLFDNDSAELSPEAVTAINQFAARFQGAAAGTPGSQPASITLEAHTSLPGTKAYNMTLAQKRADAVRAQLVSAGFTNVTSRVSDDIQGSAGASGEAAHDRRVDMIAGDGAAQAVMAHEFGHAFGLGDEYANDPGAGLGGTPQPSGTRASHDALTQQMETAGGEATNGAIYENTDNIMSLGSVVQPQHYSTFWQALTKITEVPEWALGPKGAKPAPGGGEGGGSGGGGGGGGGGAGGGGGSGGGSGAPPPSPGP
jgi:outer membrane protein OmpA-like peptidoglycan-associated protein